MPVTPVIGMLMSPIQRRGDDVLPRASIGTVPVLGAPSESAAIGRQAVTASLRRLGRSRGPRVAS